MVNASSDWSWKPVAWSWSVSLQLVLGIVGILGNLLVMLVLFRRRAFSQSTDTLIFSLGVADFLTSIFMIPVPQAERVPATVAGELYCRLVHTFFFMWLSVSASIFTLATLSIERFIAVIYPLKFNRLLERKHAVVAVLVIWLLAVVADIFIVLTISVDPASHSCQVAFSSQLAQDVAGVTSFLLHFVVPTFVMLSTQAATARALYRQSFLFGASSLRLLKAKNRVLKLLVVVIIFFIVCWGPSSISYFLYNIGVIDSDFIYGDLNQILTLLAFCNSCANPFIYTIQHPQFRQAIKELCTGSKSPMKALFDVRPDNISRGMTDDVKNDTKMTDICNSRG